MEISSTDRVRNEEVLHRVKEEWNILHIIKRRKANWIGHILRKNFLLKHVIEGKLEGRIEKMGRQEESVSSYWMTFGKEKILGIERGSTRLHPVENSLWQRVRTCLKTEYRVNEYGEEVAVLHNSVGL
jgi:hypothetical protein